MASETSAMSGGSKPHHGGLPNGEVNVMIVLYGRREFPFPGNHRISVNEQQIENMNDGKGTTVRSECDICA